MSIKTLKKDEKLSNDKRDKFSETEKADFGCPNCSTIKLKVTINPTKEIEGKNFLFLINIKSNTTIVTNVRAKEISGNIA